MAAWGFRYKTTLVWHKVRKDGGSDGRGVGFYFRNVTECVLFGVRRAARSDRRREPGSRRLRHSQPDHLGEGAARAEPW